jgi:hypothetical protein
MKYFEYFNENFTVDLDKLYNFAFVTVTIPRNLQPLFEFQSLRHLSGPF